ncbi:MAG: MJ0042-type zinc finger domain-containing protein, partial [Pseudomonas sp.]
MTDSFVTQCPHCQTSFRVSRAQLGAAHGAVRCGACLHLFNATQHLLGEQPATPKPAGAPPPRPSTPAAAPAAAKTAPPGKPPSDTLWIHDDLDLDSLDLDEELAKLEEREIQPSKSFG